MSTVELRDGTLASNFLASGMRGVDPRRRRFALNPGIYNCQLEPRESGRQDILMSTGLIAFRTASLASDDFDHALKNGNNPNSRGQQVLREIPAADFLRNALIRYEEIGMRELPSLTLMDDPVPNEKGNITKEQIRKSAQGYFAALWPAFDEIGHECPERLRECATCRLSLLGDPENGEMMHAGLIERTSRLEDQSKVEEIRQEIVGSVKAYIAWCTAKWASLVGELADRKVGAPAIAKLGPAEHHVRRNLHETEPSESATAASFGSEVAAGQAQGFRELASAMRESKGSDNTEILKLIVERQNKTDDAISTLADSVKKLVEKETV